VDTLTAPVEAGRAALPQVKPLARLVLGSTRLAMVIGILSLVAAAAVLLILGGVSTVRFLIKILGPDSIEMTTRELFLASIKLVDLVLLATVLEVVAIGLYSLFIDDTIPAPAWLRTADVEGLKNKLAGIIAVMLGVLFLEKVLTEVDAADILLAGLGITAVIWALSFFIRSHPNSE
jgi:uncharacterized membrane protein YqhA